MNTCAIRKASRSYTFWRGRGEGLGKAGWDWARRGVTRNRVGQGSGGGRAGVGDRGWYRLVGSSRRDSLYHSRSPEGWGRGEAVRERRRDGWREGGRESSAVYRRASWYHNYFYIRSETRYPDGGGGGGGGECPFDFGSTSEDPREQTEVEEKEEEEEEEEEEERYYRYNDSCRRVSQVFGQGS
ncbi:hypothetical protein E2C01_002499 [Portunus trituberculatus]|uniref:Uncharacterized protein n=1 Tax=Portunus trituberculatus TaxID=210409 RepID=A0A5B7CKJ5_PORTR|nr:hypothetical protein [Portunus trituberculatus]